MKVVVEISKEDMGSYKNAMRLGLGNSAMRKIIKGTPLPEGAEILTKEAYSDLCLRASHERKTGRWISAKVGKLFPSNDFKCSVCGNILDFDGVNAGRGDANYCPNCGAKMKGGAE